MLGQAEIETDDKGAGIQQVNEITTAGEDEKLQSGQNIDTPNSEPEDSFKQAKAKVATLIQGLRKPVSRGIETGFAGQDDFKFLTSKDLAEAARKPIEWAVANVWTLQAKLLIAAQSKAGKTFFVTSMAQSVASGRKLWSQFEIMDPGAVAIVGGEDDEREIARRLDRMCRAEGLNLEELPIFYMPASGLKLNHPRVQDFVHAECRKYGFRMMIFDPLARLMDGDENNKEVISGVLNPMSKLAREENIVTCIVHHLAKDNPDKPRPPWDRVRGSSDIASWFSCGLFLSGQLRSGRVLVEIQQRVSGRVPGEFHVDVIEVDEESAYGLGTMRLVARMDDDKDAEGNNERLIDAAKDKILELCMRKRKWGVTLSEIGIHLGYGKGLMNSAIKKLVREEQLCRFEKAEDIPDGKVLVPILAKRRPQAPDEFQDRPSLASQAPLSPFNPVTGEVFDDEQLVFPAATRMPAPEPVVFESEAAEVDALFDDDPESFERT